MRSKERRTSRRTLRATIRTMIPLLCSVRAVRNPMAKYNPSTWRKQANKEAGIWMPGIGTIGHRLRDPLGKLRLPLPRVSPRPLVENDSRSWTRAQSVNEAFEEILSIFATSYDAYTSVYNKTISRCCFLPGGFTFS